MIPTKQSNFKNKAMFEELSLNSFSKAKCLNYRKNDDRWSGFSINKFKNEKEPKKSKNSNNKKNSENKNNKSDDIMKTSRKDSAGSQTMGLLLMALKRIKPNPALHLRIKVLSKNITNKV